MTAEWAAVAASLVGAVVAAVGLYLAHSVRRNTNLSIAEPRRAAYSPLWEMTGVAAPTRLDWWGDCGTLSRTERLDLWVAMTDWYYKDGNGMLLAERSRDVYLNVKHDLVCRVRRAAATLLCFVKQLRPRFRVGGIGRVRRSEPGSV